MLWQNILKVKGNFYIMESLGHILKQLENSKIMRSQRIGRRFDPDQLHQ